MKNNRFIREFKQYGLLVVVVIVILLVLWLALFGIEQTQQQRQSSIEVDTKIEAADGQLPVVSLWSHRMESEQKELLKQIKQLKEELEQEKINNKKLLANEVSHEKNITKEKLEKLEHDLLSVQDTLSKNLQEKPTAGNIQETNAPFKAAGFLEDEEQNIELKDAVQINNFQKIRLNLKPRDLDNTPDNTIPAGSIVSSVLLGGVDASTATTSSSNPRPVILEFASDANLPRGFQSAVKNCRVIGAASGDISSERVYVRLETLTCIDKKTEQITETTVQGYVAGEDGRTGIRGIVAIKDRELMLQSLLGGVLSGASSAVSQLSSPQSNYNPFTGDVNKGQSTKDLLKQAGGQGIGGALDRYAKYHIERAEMLQPVIQIAAGRQVDIVFTKGVRFNEKVIDVNQQLNAKIQPTHSAEYTANPDYMDGEQYADVFMAKGAK